MYPVSVIFIVVPETQGVFSRRIDTLSLEVTVVDVNVYEPSPDQGRIC